MWASWEVQPKTRRESVYICVVCVCLCVCVCECVWIWIDSRKINLFKNQEKKKKVFLQYNLIAILRKQNNPLRQAPLPLLFVCFVYGQAHGLWMFWGRGLKPHHSWDPSYSSDKARSLPRPAVLACCFIISRLKDRWWEVKEVHFPWSYCRGSTEKMRALGYAKDWNMGLRTHRWAAAGYHQCPHSQRVRGSHSNTLWPRFCAKCLLLRVDREITVQSQPLANMCQRTPLNWRWD